MRTAVLIPVAALAALAGVGCASRTFSSTPRTAVEQMLLSRAVDLAIEKIELPEVRGRKVFIDAGNLESYDAGYVKVAVRARFAELGATLVESAEEADCVVEVASGALGTEYKSDLVGLPPLPVPNSPVPLPEVSLYRTVEQTALMKLLVFVHDKGEFVAAYQYYAKADRDESFILWYRFQRKDDIRTGWERADVRLRQRPAPAKENPDKPVLPDLSPK